MESAHNASKRWKRVCDLASLLLDSPTEEWDAILARECGEDADVRTRVLAVCSNYSEDDEFLARQKKSWLDSGSGRLPSE